MKSCAGKEAVGGESDFGDPPEFRFAFLRRKSRTATLPACLGPRHHQTSNDFQMLRVDGNALYFVNLLHLVNERFLKFKRTNCGKVIMRIDSSDPILNINPYL